MRRCKTYLLLSVILLASICSLAQTDRNVFLIARTLGEKVVSNGDTIRVFGFAEDLGEQPNVPGPTIFAYEGDSVHIDLWNVSQGAPHTIHLHGLDVDQQNDGVPALSFDIPHMQHGFYHFKAPHPGTYLYHCHVASTVHVQAGMYGLVIIATKNGEKKTWTDGYEYDREFSFLTSEIDTFWHQDSILDHHHDPQSMHNPVPFPVFNPQYFLINGYSDQQLKENNVKVLMEQNETVYLRLANIGYLGNAYYFPPKSNAKIVSSDGRPLPQEENSDSLYIFPGERYGVLLNINELLTDSIKVNYFDLNTSTLLNSQFIELESKTLVSIKEPDLPKLELYPNPSTSSIFIQLESDVKSDASIAIYNLNGQVVLSSDAYHLQPGQNYLEIQNSLAKGEYIIIVNTSDNRRFSSKFIKL